ncbi:mycothiol transferase [Cryobacterium tepidiphilum]|uniref:DUF664 domain-containing protein n=1 Tax=Cryobacterium tepidiphilum TaxID=2486026 RepID=A0A3M8LEP0_9MICO|nr:DUF664 domain-containing protein [Cryobacterium tepidiphilum]RNE64023.1 DUF664 domain-containing protein [Cryobacterium tepidiphilum]
MTAATDLLTDAFQRIQGAVRRAVDGLDENALTFRPDPAANSIAWLVWHLTRVQDDHIADVAGTEQLWASAGWAERFGLAFDADATGYGHSSSQVGEVRGVSAADLIGYHDAVCASTVAYLATLGDEDLERVVDTSWDPPVTLGVRLVSVITDDLQHAGQAAFVRGIAQRAR